MCWLDGAPHPLSSKPKATGSRCKHSLFMISYVSYRFRSARSSSKRTRLNSLLFAVHSSPFAVGNIFARWQGSNPELPAIATGSHIDAIPNAGRYDGVVGVLGGLEAIRSLRAADFKPQRSIELIVFTSDEPTRFGIGCLGSRLMSGAPQSEHALALTDVDGVSLGRRLEKIYGVEPDLSSVAKPKGTYAAFIELHIEQGPLLERAGIEIGVVESIAAPATLRVQITGEGGHAGAVLMPI